MALVRSAHLNSRGDFSEVSHDKDPLVRNRSTGALPRRVAARRGGGIRDLTTPRQAVPSMMEPPRRRTIVPPPPARRRDFPHQCSITVVSAPLKLYPIETRKVAEGTRRPRGPPRVETTKHLLVCGARSSRSVSRAIHFVNIDAPAARPRHTTRPFSHNPETCSAIGIGGQCASTRAWNRRQLQIFVSLLLALCRQGSHPNKCSMCRKTDAGGVSHVASEPPLEAKRRRREERQKELPATYARSLAVTRK